jgi:hypothetical protein
MNPNNNKTIIVLSSCRIRSRRSSSIPTRSAQESNHKLSESNLEDFLVEDPIETKFVRGDLLSIATARQMNQLRQHRHPPWIPIWIGRRRSSSSPLARPSWDPSNPPWLWQALIPLVDSLNSQSLCYEGNSRTITGREEDNGFVLRAKLHLFCFFLPFISRGSTVSIAHNAHNRPCHPTSRHTGLQCFDRIEDWLRNESYS